MRNRTTRWALLFGALLTISIGLCAAVPAFGAEPGGLPPGGVVSEAVGDLPAVPDVPASPAQFGTNAVVAGSDQAVAVMERLAPDAPGWLVSACVKYSWLLAVVSIMGSLRVVCKPINTILEWIVSITPSKKDDELLAKVEASAAAKWFWWLVDWLASIKKPTANTNPLVKVK